MSYQAKIILDSINKFGNRLTTFELTYPRFVHSEFMTHRMLSRNAASNRAVPIKKTVESVMADPTIPVEFGRNQSGMQARQALTGLELALAIENWKAARDSAVGHALDLERLGVHKQVVNRLLEPFQWITVIATATDWPHFFNLRAHPDAQPELRFVANMALELYTVSAPTEREQGEWHLPYIDVSGADFELDLSDKIRVSAGRCARVSYLTHDGIRDPQVDLALCDKLIVARPMHASPLEHQAFAKNAPEYTANFKGWHSYRKMIFGEYTTHLHYDHDGLLGVPRKIPN